MKKKTKVKKSEEKMKLEDQTVLAAQTLKEFAQSLGVGDFEYACSLIDTAAKSISPFLGEENACKAVVQALQDMKPLDSVEIRLIAQSAALYEFSMKSLKQCGNAEGIDYIQAMGNLALKLMRVQNETIDTLNKYRRRGEQRIEVTHSVIARQAIVNNNYGEGGSPRNQGGTPCTLGNARQKQEPMEIDHAETMQWPMEDAECTEEKA